jgi:hypothetical protein
MSSYQVDMIRTHDQGIPQEVGTRLPDQNGRDTASSEVDRRGDDDEGSESEDENEGVEGTGLAGNGLETKWRKQQLLLQIRITVTVTAPHTLP